MKYILKLHIHQHSLLTRKVFFRHNFQNKYSSLYLLDHPRVFVIFKYSSSSSHIHLQFIFIIESGSSLGLDHHWIWISTWSGSSLGIITGSRSSLDLDHFCWIIITRSGSSSLDLDHHWASSQVLSLNSSRHRNHYRASPFSYWMYHLRAGPFSYQMRQLLIASPFSY